MTIYRYFDYQATTPVDDRVIEVMVDTLKNHDGNAHSSSHPIGWRAFDLVENSRATLASFVNAKSNEIVFTSGATESNNLAIKGVANFYKNKGNHIITTQFEHKCVLESCRFLEKNGFDVTYLKPDINGLIDTNELEEAITSKTILVSIMAVNNETGVIQNLEEIGRITRKAGVFFHTDAAQAYGKIDIDVKQIGINLMSVSSHKIYGPKGIGFLYVSKNPRVKLEPIFHGGGQERGIRSGTVPVFLVAGFAKAAELIFAEIKSESERILGLKKKFLSKILKIEDSFSNGKIENSIPQCANVSFLHVEGEGLLAEMPDICLSTGSACNSEKLEPSYVITAMREDSYYAHGAVRVGFGRFTTEDDVDYLIESLTKAVSKKRKESPLWEMKKNGIDLKSINWKG